MGPPIQPPQVVSRNVLSVLGEFDARAAEGAGMPARNAPLHRPASEERHAGEPRQDGRVKKASCLAVRKHRRVVTLRDVWECFRWMLPQRRREAQLISGGNHDPRRASQARHPFFKAMESQAHAAMIGPVSRVGFLDEPADDRFGVDSLGLGGESSDHAMRQHGSGDLLNVLEPDHRCPAAARASLQGSGTAQP